MTVTELIKALQSLDPDYSVVDVFVYDNYYAESRLVPVTGITIDGMREDQPGSSEQLDDDSEELLMPILRICY